MYVEIIVYYLDTNENAYQFKCNQRQYTALMICWAASCNAMLMLTEHVLCYKWQVSVCGVVVSKTGTEPAQASVSPETAAHDPVSPVTTAHASVSPLRRSRAKSSKMMSSLSPPPVLLLALGSSLQRNAPQGN